MKFINQILDVHYTVNSDINIMDIKKNIIKIHNLIQKKKVYESLDYRCNHNDANEKILENNSILIYEMKSLQRLLNQYLGINWYDLRCCKVCFQGKMGFAVIKLPKQDNRQYYCLLKLLRDLKCILKFDKEFIIT